MSNIVNFVDFQKKKDPPSWEEICRSVVDDIIADWEKMASHNKLNEYFKSFAPAIVKDELNYMSDLSAIARLEQIIGISSSIYFPSTLNEEQIGWVVGFKIDGKSAMTISLANEAYARAFAIIMFLKLKRALLQS